MNYEIVVNYYCDPIKIDDFCVKIARSFLKPLEEFTYQKGNEIIDYVNEKRKNNSLFSRTKIINEYIKTEAIEEAKVILFSEQYLCFILYSKIYELKYGDLKQLMDFNANYVSLDFLARKKLQEKIDEIESTEFNYLAARAGAEICNEYLGFMYKLMGEGVLFEILEVTTGSCLSNFS